MREVIVDRHPLRLPTQLQSPFYAAKCTQCLANYVERNAHMMRCRGGGAGVCEVVPTNKRPLHFNAATPRVPQQKTLSSGG